MEEEEELEQEELLVARCLIQTTSVDFMENEREVEELSVAMCPNLDDTNVDCVHCAIQ